MDKWVDFNQRLIVKKLGPVGKTLLDVGCGSGAYLKIFAESLGLGSVTGLDIFKSRVPGIKTVMASGEKLPFRDNEFETVFEKDTLHHIEDKKRALSEMKRVASEYVILVEANCENRVMDYFVDKRFHRHFSSKSLGRLLEGEKYSMYFVEAFPFGSNRFFPLKVLNVLPSTVSNFFLLAAEKVFSLFSGKRAAFIVCKISVQ